MTIQELQAVSEAIANDAQRKFAAAGPVRSLTCCCCGTLTRGRQWWNRDTGYGLCEKCAVWISSRETPEDFERCYGRAGVHHSLPEVSR